MAGIREIMHALQCTHCSCLSSFHSGNLLYLLVHLFLHIEIVIHVYRVKAQHAANKLNIVTLNYTCHISGGNK